MGPALKAIKHKMDQFQDYIHADMTAGFGSFPPADK